MSLNAQPISHRNVSLRSTIKGSFDPDMAPSPSASRTIAESDLEAMMPFSTQSSLNPSSANSRDVLYRENTVLNHLSEERRKDRYRFH